MITVNYGTQGNDEFLLRGEVLAIVAVMRTGPTLPEMKEHLVALVRGQRLSIRITCLNV